MSSSHDTAATAARPGTGTARNDPIDLISDSDSGSGESSSSDDGSGRGRRRRTHSDDERGEMDGDDSPWSDDDEVTCQFRTERFHDGECERYFDCPGHEVGRVLDEDGEEDSPMRDVAVEGGPTGRADDPIPVDDDHPEEVVREPAAGNRVLRLPRWQPDAEVTYCPICRTQFSIFVRKHHCRKCGRVVCGSCSPHRITIPYQYIVQPPGAPRLPVPTMTPPAVLGSDSSSVDFGALGGGERVRLCNPCVPDPNIAPPQTQGGHSRSQSTADAPATASPQPSRGWGSYFGGGLNASEAHARSRSVTMQSAQLPRLPALDRRPLPYQHHSPDGSRLQRPPIPTSFYGRSLTNEQRAIFATTDRASGSSSAAGPSVVNRRLPPLPTTTTTTTPQIAEEDECPVCHRELPSRTLDNYEAIRESHINMCITSHSTYGGGAVASSSSGDTPLPPVPPRRTGMFPYTATEKDCVDSAECTICLEEFEVGVPMARLECLCRFHRACIGAWWQRHPGRCPMHQHDGLGY
ncbi:FYVE, RhoGEF and PH domain-containing protein 6 [Podospora conica]|nr:FYVE, RhoGEF and PH domain-containing protein 6 [Schizothecium conicum]